MAGEKVRGAYPRQWFGQRVRGEAEPAQRISDEEAWVRGVWLDSLQGAQCRTPVSRADAHRREPLVGAARDGQVHRPTRRRDRSEQRAGVHSKHGCRHGGSGVSPAVWTSPTRLVWPRAPVDGPACRRHRAPRAEGTGHTPRGWLIAWDPFHRRDGSSVRRSLQTLIPFPVPTLLVSSRLDLLRVLKTRA